MSAVSPEVAEYWGRTEREVRGKYETYLRTPPMARRRVRHVHSKNHGSSPMNDASDLIVLDAVLRVMQIMTMRCLLVCWELLS